MSMALLWREGVRGTERPDGVLAASVAKTARGAGKKAHVCFVAPYAWPVFSRDPNIEVVGGAEVQQSILARLLQQAGYRVSMVCLDFGQPDRTVIDGVTVHKAYSPEAGIPVVRFVHPRLTSIWRALAEADADIYYQRCANMLTAVVAQFCRRHGKRSIFAGASDRDFLPGKEQIRLARDRWLYRHGLRSVDRVVVQNAHQLRACREHYGLQPTLIPSCYLLPEEGRPRADEYPRDRILWCATVHTQKRPQMFLELARRLPQRKFVMVGGPSADDAGNSFYERVRAEAQSLPNVEFKGFLPLAQVEPWFDRAHVFVNTSEYEGMPNTFMQAWARGIPTVASVDVGARAEGELVYATFERPGEAAAELERLFVERDYWERRAAQVRRYFEATHSSSHVLTRYAALLDELLP
jgi:glycosyltransferase involved in cell wall biosynthesis